MNIENLVKMANQIGAFFEAMPDRTQAVADVAAHLQRSWEPRMRAALVAHVDGQGGDLRAIVRAAVIAHRGALAPDPAPADARG
ncbi:NADH-dependent formate dehydrogenase delta subunit FdsD [mine drainage metagenome]|uniref:NADH-dependent formate dehydrogenase delta subunit FdsD n=1 Tax=mine drainage metagenome TaxID=410659 RepID=A0A1J5RGU3_9ZZZZ